MRLVPAIIVVVFASAVNCGYLTPPSQILELPKIQPAHSGYNVQSAQYSPAHVSAAGVALTIPGRTAPYTLVQGNRQYVNQYRAQQNYYAQQNKVNYYNNYASHGHYSPYQVQSQQAVNPSDLYSNEEQEPLPPATGVQPPNLRPNPPQPIPTSQPTLVSKPVEIDDNVGPTSQETYPNSFLPEVVQLQLEPANTVYLQPQPTPAAVPVYYGFHPIAQLTPVAPPQLLPSQTVITEQSHPELLANTEPTSPEQLVSYTISNADNLLLQQYKNSQYSPQPLDGINISGLDNAQGAQVADISGNQVNQDITYRQQYAHNGYIDQNNQQSLDLINNYNTVQIPTSSADDSGFVNTRPAQPIVTKHIYLHVPPPDTEDPPVALPPPPPKKTYNIIFLKVPSHDAYNRDRILQQLQAEAQQSVQEKTLIYVLVRKPEVDAVSLSQVQQQPSKPEVYFVKYKGNLTVEEEESQQLQNSTPDLTPVLGHSEA